ncbi:MAG: hypothetical protein FWH19_00250 [Treponema sp.]|nr:hypothetical protein [Treponema sp.]
MNKGIGMFLMNIAVACYLFCAGILGVNNNWFQSSEIRKAVTDLLGRGDFTNILVVVLSVLAIVAGVCILLRLFNISLPLPIDLILIILAIVWVVLIILMDIIPGFQNFGKGNFVAWLMPFSVHLMVLAGISLSTERFGG